MKHLKPYDNTPSAFVVNCLKTISEVGSKLALDLPCGYGRHSIFLKAAGYEVIAADINSEALESIKTQNFNGQYIDATKELPFAPNSFGLVVVVHYVQTGLIFNIARILVPGGYLIYETFGAHGENWKLLPQKDEILSELKGGYKTISLKERPAGPKGSKRVSIKLYAQKLPF